MFTKTTVFQKVVLLMREGQTRGHTCFQIQTGMCRDRKSDNSVTRKRNDKRVLFMGDTGNKPIRFVLN